MSVTKVQFIDKHDEQFVVRFSNDEGEIIGRNTDFMEGVFYVLEERGACKRLTKIWNSWDGDAYTLDEYLEEYVKFAINLLAGSFANADPINQEPSAEEYIENFFSQYDFDIKVDAIAINLLGVPIVITRKDYVPDIFSWDAGQKDVVDKIYTQWRDLYDSGIGIHDQDALEQLWR